MDIIGKKFKNRNNKLIYEFNTIIGNCYYARVASENGEYLSDSSGWRKEEILSDIFSLIEEEPAQQGSTPVQTQNAEKKEETEGGNKHDSGKNRLELIPYEAIEQIGLALTFGAKKYSDNNWRKGFKWSRLIGALLRHIFSWAAGHDKDPESGLSNLAHAGACLVFLIAHEQLNYGEDDRIKTKS